MKKIKIAHLYYDLMNLYGENGNVLCLKKYLENQNIDVTIDYLTKEDKIDFTNYDIFYIGSGNDESFLITLDDLKKYKKELETAIKNKFFIVTGNALNLFGKTYYSKNKELELLNIFNYSVKENKKRLVGEQLYKCDLINSEIIGFENRSTYLIDNNESHLFESIKGFGNRKNEKNEGILKNNFYGTYLLGPLLVRNPYFTSYIVKKICDINAIKFKEVYNDFEIKAYENYKELIKQK